jgi:hypothetical protein
MDFTEFGGRLYFIMLACLLISRGMDALSTWVATPNLVLEANPIAKKMGWRWGLLVNVLLCIACATWPFPAIIISTTSLLVASRNFQTAWVMRAMGEEAYRLWFAERVAECGLPLYLTCVAAQSLLMGGVGAALMIYGVHLVPFAIGTGIVTYAAAVSFYTLLSVWRLRRFFRNA